MAKLEPIDIKKKSVTKKQSCIVKLDFKGKEKLLDNLKRSADKNFRTVEQQALFYIWAELSPNEK